MEYLVIRLGCSFLTGIVLSQAGSFIQLGTRNILASPSTLGFDGLAILWILSFHSFQIWPGLDLANYWSIVIGVPLFLIIGFLFSGILNKGTRFERVILLGITFNLLVGAIFSLWQFLFLAFNLPFPVELWFGHFRYSSVESLGILFLLEFMILIGLQWQWKEMMIYSLGKGPAMNFNINGKILFAFLFTTVAVSTFVAINLFGAFSFLALIFPIIARKLWFKKFDLWGEIIIGSLLNGLILMLTDFVCYYFPVFGAEIPVGLIITSVGAVFLILLLWSSESRELLAKSRK